MRFAPTQHKADCGIDRQARRLSVCILRQDGASLLPRTLQPRPQLFRKAIAPSRQALVGAGAGLLTWYGLAARCAREALPGVLRPARSRKALHGGTATHDTIAAQPLAVRLRGGMGPQAYGAPAARRAPRDRRRRRGPLVRQRAERLTPVQHTPRQAPVPEMGQARADTTTRPGGAERGAAPAVPQSVAGARALIAYDAQRLRARELTMGQTAPPHDAHTVSLLQSVPGIGKRLRRGLVEERQARARCPRLQEVVSCGRLVPCAKASAGPRDDPAATKIGHASLPWALSEAAVRGLRPPPGGQH